MTAEQNTVIALCIFLMQPARWFAQTLPIRLGADLIRLIARGVWFIITIPFVAAEKVLTYLLDNWQSSAENTKRAALITVTIICAVLALAILAGGILMIVFGMSGFGNVYPSYETNHDFLFAENRAMCWLMILWGFAVIYGLLRSVFEKQWFHAGVRYLVVPVVLASGFFFGALIIGGESTDKLNALTVTTVGILAVWILFSIVHFTLWAKEILSQYTIALPEIHIAFHFPITFTRLTAAEWEEVMKNRASRN